MRPSRVLVLVAVFSVCYSLVAAGFLERSVQFQTPVAGTCFTTKFQNTHLLELTSFRSNIEGFPFYGVRDEIGRLGRIGQLKYICPPNPVGTYKNGIVHVTSIPCDCPNDGTTVCDYKLRLESNGIQSLFDIFEGSWSVPIRTLLTPVTAPFVLVQSSINSTFPTASHGCTAFVNNATVAGKYALIDRGTCAFQDKVNNAIAAGAVGVVIVNSQGSSGFEPSIQTSSIPVVMVSFTTGQAIRAAGAIAGSTLSLGKQVGPRSTFGNPQYPPGLLYTPFVSLDDDADYTIDAQTLQYVKGRAYLDPREYLWTIGANGNFAAQVWDLSQGLSQISLLATLPFSTFRDLSPIIFVRPAQNPTRLFAIGTNFFTDRIHVFDATNVNSVTLIDSLPLPGSQRLVATEDGRFLFAESTDSFTSVPRVQIFSLAGDGILNPVGVVSRTDVNPVGATIAGLSVRGNSLYVGWGSYGLTAYDITRPDRPTFIARFLTYDAVATLPYTVGVLDVCTVPTLPDIAYIVNVDELGRNTFQGFRLTRANEQFLATSSSDQLVTIRTLVSGGVTRVNVESSSFIEGSISNIGPSNSSVSVIGLPSRSSSSSSSDSSDSSISRQPVVVSSSSASEVAPPPRFRYQNQTLPPGVVIFEIPVPIYINTASTLTGSMLLALLLVVFAL